MRWPIYWHNKMFHLTKPLAILNVDDKFIFNLTKVQFDWQSITHVIHAHGLKSNWTLLLIKMNDLVKSDWLKSQNLY
jgi:hypothetical protein